MGQISDTATIEAMVEKILADNMKQVEAYRGGKTKLQGFFVGQVDVYSNLEAKQIFPDRKTGSSMLPIILQVQTNCIV